LKISVETGNFEIAKTIFDKFVDCKEDITAEPNFKVYFMRYYSISSYLANRPLDRNTKVSMQ
jgi:hypothetical protein